MASQRLVSGAERYITGNWGRNTICLLKRLVSGCEKHCVLLPNWMIYTQLSLEIVIFKMFVCMQLR